MEVEKNRYYVTLQAGTTNAEIREADPNNPSTYDFEVEASRSQMHELRKMLQEAHIVDVDSYFHGHILFTDLAEDDNKTYDSILRDIYRMIYQTGTADTKAKMEQMGIVSVLKLDEKPLRIT